MSFHLAEGLDLPDNATTQTFALLGRRGSGKTYGAGKLAELFLGGGHQVVIVDPVGTWWGLRLAADGVSPGIRIPVFGGQHGDIPLEATAGALVAQLVAERGTSVVLDVSEFTGADQRRFVADFATELLHLKKKNRSPLMTIWDEAQEFVPQLVRPDHARMVGAMEKLVKLGRNFGVGVGLISQRPQAVHKDVLNQTEVLIVFQLTGPQERKVIEGWVSDHGFGKKEVDEIPRLQPGTAFVWSPQWLGRFVKVKIAKKKTFDASATPEEGDVVAAGRLADVDLDQVREQMAATIEAAKESDPKLLKAEIARLRAELATAPGRADMVAKISEDAEVLASERDYLREQLAGLEGATPSEVRRLRHLETFFEKVIGAVDGYRAAGDGKYARGDFSEKAEPSQVAPPRFVGLPPKPADLRVVSTRKVKATTGDMPQATRRILTALAQCGPRLTRRKLSIVTGYPPGGSSIRNNLSICRGNGWIEDVGDDIAITADGRKALGPFDPLPTGRALIDYWMRELPEAATKILTVCLGAYPKPVTREHLARVTGYPDGGSSIRNNLSKLRGLELVEDVGEDIRAADDLFGGQGRAAVR